MQTPIHVGDSLDGPKVLGFRQSLETKTVSPGDAKPPSTPFRMKGCRWSLLYDTHLPKEGFYSWFQKNIITKKCDGKLKTFIGHIIIGSTKMTKVIFKTDCLVDWKDQSKFDFPVPDYEQETEGVGMKNIRPEIKCIYKTQWGPEYQNLTKSDPFTYPKLDPTSSAKSPRPLCQLPPQPVPVPKTPVPSPTPSTPPVQPPTPLVLTEPGLDIKITGLSQKMELLESHIVYLSNKYADLVKFNNMLARKINTDIDTGVYVKIVSEVTDTDNKSIIQYGVTKSKTLLKSEGIEPSIFVSISDILLDDALKLIRDCLTTLPPSIISVTPHNPEQNTYIIKNSDIFILEKIVSILF